jgi:hypothetical protein
MYTHREGPGGVGATPPLGMGAPSADEGAPPVPAPEAPAPAPVPVAPRLDLEPLGGDLVLAALGGAGPEGDEPEPEPGGDSTDVAPAAREGGQGGMRGGPGTRASSACSTHRWRLPPPLPQRGLTSYAACCPTRSPSPPAEPPTPVRVHEPEEWPLVCQSYIRYSKPLNPWLRTRSGVAPPADSVDSGSCRGGQGALRSGLCVGQA